MKNSHSKIILAALFLGSANVGFGQTAWDFSATPDRNWSTFANWDTNISPAGTAVTFGALGVTGSNVTVSNIVDANYSISSLLYNANSTSWQVTQINTPQTLTVGGNFTVGTGVVAAAQNTRAAFTGTGSLAITSGTLSVSNGGASNNSTAVLDMSGLTGLNATLTAFNIGNTSQGYGTVYLADNSTITATSLTSGGTSSGYGSTVSNKLYFGTTTTLNISTLNFGTGQTFGTFKFRASGDGAANNTTVTGATLKIRASDGTSAATAMNVGVFTGGLGGNGTTALDLTGGSVDAKVTTLKVGVSSGALSNTAAGTLNMSAGTFDATTAVVGESSSATAGTGNVTGNLNVSGGTFTAGTMTLANNTGTGNNRAAKGNLTVSGTGTVNVTGNLVMGNRVAATVTSTVNVSGGTLLINGNLAEGSGTTNNVSTVNLSSGTLNMDHGNVAVDTFNFTGGTLKDVANFTGALTLQNSSALAFGVDSSFTTLTLAGALDLSASSNLILSLANGFTPGSPSFTLVDNDGIDSITGTFGTINGLAFGAGNSFTLTNNLGSFNYVLSYLGGDGNDLVAIAAVPEPSTYLLLGSGLLGLFFLRRIRSKA